MRSWATARQGRVKRGLGVFVVLVFGLRALIPSGYMLATVDGHSRLIICPSGIYYAHGMHAMAAMAHGPSMAHGEHATQGTDQCPFALSGGAAFSATAGAAAEPHFVIVQPTRARAPASVPLDPPPRHHAARGPPFLA